MNSDNWEMLGSSSSSFFMELLGVITVKANNNGRTRCEWVFTHLHHFLRTAEAMRKVLPGNVAALKMVLLGYIFTNLIGQSFRNGRTGRILMKC